MHKPSLSQLVYHKLFPKPRTNDPASFASHITRNLVPEVRVETSTFYGALDCIEAQYPGLDYSYPPHRMRLGRFPCHRKLFKVFDELGLTEIEIASLCRWEGTKSARDRYERDEGIHVRDTTADDVRTATPPPRPSVHVHSWTSDSLHTQPDHEPLGSAGQMNDTIMESHEEFHREHEVEGDSSDEEVESYGAALNRHLLEATAARERGANVPLDEDWEQWLKEAVEHGGYADMINAIRAGQPLEFSFSNMHSSSPSTSSNASAVPGNQGGHDLSISRQMAPSLSASLYLPAQSNFVSSMTATNPAIGPSSNSTTRTAG